MISNINKAQMESHQISLLQAAIQHLQVMYLNSPNSCLSGLINRNYSLLLKRRMTSKQRSKLLKQQSTWQSYCQSTSSNQPYDLNNISLSTQQSGTSLWNNDQHANQKQFS